MKTEVWERLKHMAIELFPMDVERQQKFINNKIQFEKKERTK